MIELTLLKKLILINEANQKSAIFFTIGIFQIKALSVNQMSAMSAMIFMNLSDIATLNIKSACYHCVISRISKSEAINLMQSNDLTKKTGTL